MTHLSSVALSSSERTESKKLATVSLLQWAVEALVELHEVASHLASVVEVATEEDSAAGEDTVEDTALLAATVEASVEATVAAQHLAHQELSSTSAICPSKLAGKNSRTSSGLPATSSELTSTWASTAGQRVLVS